MSRSPRLPAIAAELRKLEKYRARLLAEQAELIRREANTLPLALASGGSVAAVAP